MSVIAQALPADVHQLMLVTPTDTKMFNLTEASHAQPVRTNGAAVAQAEAVVDEPDEAEPDFESDPQAEAIRLAEEGDRAAQAAGLEQAQVEAQTAETPAQRREALKQIRKASGEAGQEATCGRCRGAGQINIALPDGGATTSSCPVCQGHGTIRRYGGRRQ